MFSLCLLKKKLQLSWMTAKHIAPRCLPCEECNTAGLSVVKCRVTSKHKAENSETPNLTCNQLPKCCSKLASLSHISDKDGKPAFITGFLYEYSEDKWFDWIRSYSLQTSGNYVATRGNSDRKGTTKAGIIRIGKKIKQ